MLEFLFSMLIVSIFSIIGVFITSFTLLSSIICLTFAIPLTRKLEQAGMLVEKNPIMKRYFGSASFLLVMFILISYLFYRFSSGAVFVGYIFGVSFVVLKGIFKTSNLKANSGNLSDYIETESNAKYFKKSKDEIIIFLSK